MIKKSVANQIQLKARLNVCMVKLNDAVALNRDIICRVVSIHVSRKQHL